MSKKTEIVLLLLSDLIFVNLAWTVYYEIRIASGWIPYTSPPEFLIPLSIIYIYWLIVFSLSGLYQHWYVRSRFDEFTSIVKTVSLGAFLLFFAIFLDDAMTNARVISRFLILIYWALMIISVSIGRIFIRSFQINMLEKGIGLRNALIVGTGQRAKELHNFIKKFPQLGYRFSGYVGLNGIIKSEGILGNLSSIDKIIADNEVSEVLIALESQDKNILMDVLKYCSQEKVNLKIMPDTYEIVSGMVKTNQIYGVPLIEVMPEILSHSSKLIKRFIDIFVSVTILLLLLPLWLLIAVLIKLTSKGGIFYKQIRVGRNGRTFTMYKFRSMIANAEEYGPEWAGESDSRITSVGRIIRKMYIDEIPQLINVIKNEMSLVGPRPERPHFVEILKQEIPYYFKRLNIKPGITGWAQIKHKYDRSLDDVRVKLQYDFFYIENMSLKLDFKIIINTLLVILLMKGH